MSVPSRSVGRRLDACRKGGALLLVGLICGACGGGGDAVAPGVLLIAIDGLRADHLRYAGYDRETSPTLDELAREGVSFDSTIAAAPWLVPAHIALLAGVDPTLGQRGHDWLEPSWLEPSVERRWRLPDVLSTGGVEYLASGWSTAAFSDHEWLSPHFGFSRGFQVFEFSDLDAAPRPGGSGAGGLVPKLERWVRSLDRDEPWFAYLHLNDLLRSWPHADAQWDTYFEPRPELASVPPVGSVQPVFFAVPPTRWSGGSEALGVYEARYDGALRRLDEDLRRLFDSLRLLGRWEDTTLCVVGSHGLQFGESGLIVDSGRLTLADLDVPWILRPAQGLEFEPGRRIDALASTVDVLPTLLDLTGLGPAESMTGVSQRALLRGDGPAPRKVAFASCGLQLGYAAFDERFTYERTHPGLAVHAGLVESWFGDREPHSEYYELYYDRSEHPVPPLNRFEELAYRGNEPLERVAEDWALGVEQARAAVQRDRLDDETKLLALERLRALHVREAPPR